jgi:hypothetical protein
MYIEMWLRCQGGNASLWRGRVHCLPLGIQGPFGAGDSHHTAAGVRFERDLRQLSAQ